LKALILAVLLVAPLAAQYNGLGASTVTCLDKDGDGYGVGTTCTARDADDDDPAVHTATEAITKWGSMTAFLAHRGYSPLRIWYIDDGGNDADCNATPRDIAHPCATFANIDGSLLAGDLVFWRAGSYTERLAAYNAVTGTSSNPIIYMAYPGETVTITNTTPVDLCASGYTPQERDYITVDGFILDGDPATGSEAANLCYNDHVTIRYTEAKNHGRGFFGSFMTNTTVEYNVSHDTNAGGNPSHTLYFGARETPLDGLIIRNNIFWNPGRSCLQLNGRFNSPVVDGNWCYGYDSTAGISLEMGVNGAQVRNNVVWNGQAKPFVMYLYPNQTDCGIATIQPYNMQNNVIENNTFVIPQKRLDGSAFAGSPNIEIAVEVDYSETYSFSGTIFRNNVLVNHSGYYPVSIHTASMDCEGHVSTPGGYRTRGFQDPAAIAAQLTWQNNIVYQSTPVEVLWTWNTQSTFGTPPAVPDLIDTKYALAAWQAIGTNTGTLTPDPSFTAYNHAWYATPASFNFRPTSTSPAVNTGHTSTAATRDVLGHQRSVTPSIGAYQYASGGTALALNNWVSRTSRGATHGSNGWDRMVYARSAKRSLLWGMYQENSTEPNQTLGGFDFESARWDVIDTGSLFAARGLPESGHNQGMAYNPTTGTVFWQISGSGSNAYENRWYTIEYDPVGQVGRLRPGTTKANQYSNYQSTSAYDSTNNKFVIWNGDTFTYDPTTDAWTQQSPTCSVACPPAMYNASMDFNAADGKIYLFGGSTSGTGGTNQDVYTYNVATNTWTKLSPSGTPPSARWKAGWAYDSLNSIFLLWGGETGNTSGILNDTWVFNPSGSGSWTQLSPSASPSAPSSSPWERLTYDADHNVFALFLNDSTGTYAAGTNACCNMRAWFFRYSGTGPDIGMLDVTVSPTAGGLNEQPTGWAKEPAVLVNGSTLYTAWSEMDKPDTVGSASRWAHIFAKSFTSPNWADVGGAYSSVNSENSGSLEAHMPSLALVNSELWTSYHAALPPTVGLEPVIYAKKYSGGAWSGGAIGKVNNAAGVYQSRSSLSSIGTTPYIAFIESDKSGGLLAGKAYLYLRSFNGSSWVNANSGTALNRDGGACDATNCTIATSVATATDSTNLYVAFTEHLTNNFTADTAGKVYVSKWNGSTLTAMGGALNNSGACFATDAAITYMGSQPYVAWTERCAVGVNKVYVKTTADGSTWTLVGAGALNRDGSTGWAMNPSLANDGTNLYLAWAEQQAIGQKPQVHVSQYSGSWSDLGTSLNKDATGSAQTPTVTVLSGQPAVVWGEVQQGAYRQIYAAAWDGASAWTALDAAGNSGGVRSGGKVTVGGKVTGQ
jgi:hypothetical protein